MVFAGVEFPCPQLSTFCRRRPTWVPPKYSIFIGPQFLNSQITVFIKSFSSRKSPPGVCRNDSEPSFTASYLINSVGSSEEDAPSVSEKSPPDVCGNDSERTFTFFYLINSCGLSSEAALSVSKKLCIKSPRSSDAVLELLRKYGFTDAHISRLVAKSPRVLLSSRERTLLPKLEFFCSIGVPLPALADTLTSCPDIFRYSLKNYLIPWYNCCKSIVQSDEEAVLLFWQTIGAYRPLPSNVALLRKHGLPKSSIASLLQNKPSLMCNGEEKIATYIDRAAKIGFDKEKIGFVKALQVFGAMSDSTLMHKMNLYRRCGWSESDINLAFLNYPLCMKCSEKKIMAHMDFLVNKMGLEPTVVARYANLLSYSLEKRIKPRCWIVGFLNEKGLLKRKKCIPAFLIMSEEKFLKRYIVDYQDDFPLLLDIYRGKSPLPEMGFHPTGSNEKISFDFKQVDADI